MHSKWNAGLSGLAREARWILGTILALVACSTPAWAGFGVPEISPASAGSAMTLLIGATFLLRDRIQK